jgi:hypothetical protein
MNNAKRNRLKNKNKIKQLKEQIRKLKEESSLEEESQKDLAITNNKVSLLQAEVYALHRFIRTCNLENVEIHARSFNVPYPDFVRTMSSGALTAEKLDAFRFVSYQTPNNPDPLYMIGLVPDGNLSKEYQISFYLSKDLIRDVPVDYIFEKNIKQLLKSRKEDLLRSTFTNR